MYNGNDVKFPPTQMKPITQTKNETNDLDPNQTNDPVPNKTNDPDPNQTNNSDPKSNNLEWSQVARYLR